MTKIIGIAGSLRNNSYNSALLRAASELAPQGVALEIATLKGIPLYDGDLETIEGIPSAVITLQEQIAAADGLLMATPEYNNSMPGVFKNALDWLSRPPGETARIFGNRPVVVIGATPGGFGTVLSQNAWLPVLRTLGTRPWFGGRLLVSRAHQIFNESGEMTDAAVRKQLEDFLAGFVEFIQINNKS
ncbi:MAG: NAD(P)H-dependent oxidoreductase [Nitrosomonas sp.]|nr:NAD(P)H-dependent oxidoreductase [Nitrosomonas sp.]MBP6074838.1 NAD(P)H-dependent oxidoreductase [Nitrosomonas sp.]